MATTAKQIDGSLVRNVAIPRWMVRLVLCLLGGLATMVFGVMCTVVGSAISLTRTVGVIEQRVQQIDARDQEMREDVKAISTDVRQLQRDLDVVKERITHPLHSP